MRNPLLENQTIKLTSTIDTSHTRTFTIQKFLGNGASCMAYRAIDANQIPVVIKECYPCNATIREKNGTLIWNTLDEEARVKERFDTSFKIQRQIQSVDGTMNTNVNLIDGLYAGNNTLYTVSAIQNAGAYNEADDSSLQEIFITARAIARAVGQYHAHGFLHLDIKPQNILILPETRDIIKLLDFDSVVQKADVSQLGTAISYTHEYAAPELLQGKRRKLCNATDIYSIGAILFSRIMGYTPSVDDRGTFSDWSLAENPLFERLSKKTQRLTKELLRKTLSASIRGRYQSTSELIKALDCLVEESDPKRRHLVSTFAPSRNYFTGRNAELGQIHAAFTSGKHAIFLYGMGGIGKTELALRYAEQYGEHYDVIAFGRVDDSLGSLFKSSDFIHIENDAKGNVSIKSIRGLADEHTLLIIDNFDSETDPMLDAVLSLKCNLLFTSRNSFADIYSSDSSAMHLDIGKLSFHEQITLFEHECGTELTEEERGTVQHILQEIDGYTLLIPLIAKTYKNDNYTLIEMQERIRDAGIKGASGVRVRHHKDTTISDSAYAILCEVLNMTGLSEDETHVMRSLALLGGIVIDRKEFNAWLGGQYKDAVSSLAEKSWIQLQGSGSQAKVSLHKVIGEIARDVLKPDLENCKWAKDLCEDIACELASVQEYSESENEYWVIPDNLLEMSSAADRSKRIMIIRLLMTILNNLNYLRTENNIFTVKLLSKIYLDDLTLVQYYGAADTSLLEHIISSPSFFSISDEYKYDAHCLLNIMLLATLSDTVIPSRNDNNEDGLIFEYDNLIGKIINNMIVAENILNNLANEEHARIVKSSYNIRMSSLRLSIPLMKKVCQRGIGRFCGPDDKYYKIKESFRKLCNYILALFENILIPQNMYDEVDAIVKGFLSEFKSETRRERLFHAIFYPPDDGSFDKDYNCAEVEQHYDKFFETNVDSEKWSRALDRLSKDLRFLQKGKIEYLLNKVESLGFDPYGFQSGMADDVLSHCVCEEKLNKIVECMKYLAIWSKEIGALDDFHGQRYIASELLLASYKNDLANTPKYIEQFYNFEKSFLHEGFACDIILLKEALEKLNYYDTANLLIQRGIELLAAEIQNGNILDTSQFYNLCESLICLAECVNDTVKINSYKEKQQESLGLGFIIE